MLWEIILLYVLVITMILEFFMSTFTFNIWIELASIPIITIFTVMNVIAERKAEYKNDDSDCIFSIDNSARICFGAVFKIWIVYSVLIIPLEYALALYSKYELLFLRMTFKKEKDKKLKLDTELLYSVHVEFLFLGYCYFKGNIWEG